MVMKQPIQLTSHIVWKDMGYVTLESVHGQLSISTCGKMAELAVHDNMLTMYQLTEIQQAFNCDIRVEAIGLFVGYEEVSSEIVIHMTDVRVSAVALMKMKGIDLEIEALKEIAEASCKN